MVLCVLSVIIFLHVVGVSAYMIYLFVSKDNFWMSDYDYTGCKCVGVSTNSRGNYYVCDF